MAYEADSNGLDVIGFDGTADHMISPDAANTWDYLHLGPATYFGTFDAPTVGGGQNLVDTARASFARAGLEITHNGVGGQVIAQTFNAAGVAQTWTVSSAPGSVPLGTRARFVIRYSEAEVPQLTFLLNGAVIYSGPRNFQPPGGTSFQSLNVGQLALGGRYWSGTIRELGLVQRYITDAEQAMLDNYLSIDWP
jgi:hypothetical protein